MNVLLNLSGHPVPKGAEGFHTVSVQVPNVDLASAEAVAEAAKALVNKVLEDASAREALQRGEALVLLPGATCLAVGVLALLVGFSGSWPELRWAVKTEGGFVLSPGLALDALKLQGRALR